MPLSEEKRLGHPSHPGGNDVAFVSAGKPDRVDLRVKCGGGNEEVEKRERVDLGHGGGDDRVNPRGLSHPILSSNEPKTGNGVSAVTCFWRTY